MSAPRLGFVGLGWIGAMRLEAAAAGGAAEVTALCDTDADRLAGTAEAHPEAMTFEAYEDLVDHAGELRLDGVVIATPNALHAPQTLSALERGLAVFCQKPLARTAAEAREMVEAARRADRLLGVDYSYRHTDAARALQALAGRGELGRIFSIDSVFHNAYGPDKEWCHDVARAGGGALMDLGVHLIDLVLWLLGRPSLRATYGGAYREGEPLGGEGGIDDFATARLELDDGAVANLAVSWNAHAGRDCIIRTTVFGTAGGAELRNIGGSFYDFELVRFDGRTERSVSTESGEWLGRGLLAWIERLADSRAFDPACLESVAVSDVVDAIYARAAVPAAGALA